MLSYIAAVATAATLLISPVLSRASESAVAHKNVAFETHKEVIFNTQIVINTPPPVYVLSKVEQSILRSALFRSVKVLSPIHQS